jgi:hypothetical protein
MPRISAAQRVKLRRVRVIRRARRQPLHEFVAATLERFAERDERGVVGEASV